MSNYSWSFLSLGFIEFQQSNSYNIACPYLFMKKQNEPALYLFREVPASYGLGLEQRKQESSRTVATVHSKSAPFMEIASTLIIMLHRLSQLPGSIDRDPIAQRWVLPTVFWDQRISNYEQASSRQLETTIFGLIVKGLVLTQSIYSPSSVSVIPLLTQQRTMPSGDVYIRVSHLVAGDSALVRRLARSIFLLAYLPVLAREDSGVHHQPSLARPRRLSSRERARISGSILLQKWLVGRILKTVRRGIRHSVAVSEPAHIRGHSHIRPPRMRYEIT